MTRRRVDAQRVLVVGTANSASNNAVEDANTNLRAAVAVTGRQAIAIAIAGGGAKNVTSDALKDARTVAKRQLGTVNVYVG